MTNTVEEIRAKQAQHDADFKAQNDYIKSLLSKALAELDGGAYDHLTISDDQHPLTLDRPFTECFSGLMFAMPKDELVSIGLECGDGGLIHIYTLVGDYAVGIPVSGDTSVYVMVASKYKEE